MVALTDHAGHGLVERTHFAQLRQDASLGEGLPTKRLLGLEIRGDRVLNQRIERFSPDDLEHPLDLIL